jgi:hypothetical protein
MQNLVKPSGNSSVAFLRKGNRMVNLRKYKRKRVFIDSWSKDFDGLQDSSDGMICTYSMNGHCRLLSSALRVDVPINLREYDSFINTGD